MPFKFNPFTGDFDVITDASNVVNVGTIDSQTANSNGAVATTDTIYLQSASGTNPGLVNNTTQTFSGDKTITGGLSVNSSSTSIILSVGSGDNNSALTLVNGSNAYIDGQLLVKTKSGNNLQSTTVFQAHSGQSGLLTQWLNSGGGVTLASIDINGNLTTAGIIGTTTNDNATAGNVGEYISANPGAGVTPGSSTAYTTITSISLTAGDWDVEGIIALVPGATLAATQIDGAISKTNNAIDATNTGGICSNQSFLVTGTPTNYMNTGTRRISLSGTSTIYLTAALTYTVLGSSTYGTSSYIRARRIR